MGYVIGVDIGTSSTKAVLFDTAGRQVARCAQRYGLSSPEPGAAEQDPDEILRATTQTVADVVVAARINPNQLLGVSFSAAMHTLLLVDEANRPLTPLYTWADNRSDRFSFIANAKDPQLYQRTGLPAHPMSPVIKLMWLRDQQPDLFSQAARVVAI
ncbi:MAG: FGGY family carbohydrate kinase, partial [Cyanobacteria bacterium J06553_1]